MQSTDVAFLTKSTAYILLLPKRRSKMTEKKAPTRRRKKNVESVTPKIEGAIPKEIPVKETLEEIKVAPPIKATLTTERTLKVVAIKNTSGTFGKSRFELVDGKTYSFPTELASWLIQTGRAK